MKWNAISRGMALSLAMAVVAQAQFSAPPRPPDQRSQGNGPVILHLAPPPGPMGGIFSFVGPLSEVNSEVVKGQPFSAEVVRDSVQQLADGNRIRRQSTGMIARDSQGRTRREITLENIGPWAAEGKVPHLVIIDDPVAGNVYTLVANKKIAIKMPPAPKLRWIPGDEPGSRPMSKLQSDTQTKPLGEKQMDGVVVEGTETIHTIPAGQIGNEKPIVITSVRWYSPSLETTVRLTRNDPRFGTTTYELKNINLSEPAPSLFEVPSDYTIQSGKVDRVFRRAPDSPGAGPEFP